MSVVEKATEVNRLMCIKYPATDKEGKLTIDKVCKEYKRSIHIILDSVLWKIWGIYGKEVIGFETGEIIIDPVKLEKALDKSIAYYEKELKLEPVGKCAICGTITRQYYLCDHCDTAETGPVCHQCVDWERFDDSYYCLSCPDRSDVKWAKETIEGLTPSNGYVCNRKVVKLILEQTGGFVIKWATKYWINFKPAYKAYPDSVYKIKECTRDDYKVWITQASMYHQHKEWE